jgi:hypothetical protein
MYEHDDEGMSSDGKSLIRRVKGCVSSRASIMIRLLNQYLFM